MQKHNINANRGYFSVLQTAKRTQVAMMTLRPGEASGPKANEHPDSEQVVLLLEGRLDAEIGDERSSLEAGDVVIIPTNVAHRLTNSGSVPAVTFNVYGPPAY
jgi:mannose-6-phosphate isomerase-like protein (cupin superfamily)